MANEESAVLVKLASNQLTIAGAPIFDGGESELLVEIDRLVRQTAPALVVTPNVDQVLNLEQDADFATVFREADIRILDGMPLVLLGRVLGSSQIERHTGADLIEVLAREATARRWRIAVAGGAPEVGAAAVAALRQRYPDSDVLRIDFPFVDEVSSEVGATVIADLVAAQPAIVFLCLGSPKQEKWFAAWKHELPAAVYIGAGAAVDFAAGNRRRAPRWVQRAALEWLWRLIQEPSRLARRYLIKGPRFFRIAVASIMRRSE